MELLCSHLATTVHLSLRRTLVLHQFYSSNKMQNTIKTTVDFVRGIFEQTGS